MSNKILAGRYELLGKIGDGGMAVVYKARCRLLNRYVAIKILKPQFAKDLKFIENFRRESQAAASLSHHNIVNVYDVGREGNIHYIVMELIEGYILSDLIKVKGHLEWREAVEITRQISSALSFAHKNHIIHRDVKPHNILITKEGVAKITDFGIARALNASTIAENTGTVMGSVHYFSPEQARGSYVDEKSDIYSLGIVMYEMLTGSVPFDADNPVAVALKHISEPMVPPSRIVPDIPREIEAIVMKATDKVQINRYGTADELKKALDDAKFQINMAKNNMFSTLQDFDIEENSSAETKNSNNEFEFYYHDRHENSDKEDSAEMRKGIKTNKNGKGKKSLDKVKIAAIIAALVIALPLSYLVATGIMGISFGKGDIEVPDLSGMTYAEAEAEAEKLGLKIEEGNEVYSYDYEDGLVASQRPRAGSDAKKNDVIKVSLSKGSKEGSVPNIEGKDLESAIEILEKYGFEKGSVITEESDMPKDIVIGQNPKGGSEAKSGTRVDITISSGTETKQGVVPKLVSKDLDEAKELLEKAGLKPGEIQYEFSNGYDKNEVTWQEYAEGKELKEGDTVDLRVSKGSASSEGGNSKIPLTLDYSNAQNSVVWVTVTVSDESGTHNIITRAQRTKDDPKETITLSGEGKGTVTVIFDDQIVMKKSVDFNSGEIN